MKWLDTHSLFTGRAKESLGLVSTDANEAQRHTFDSLREIEPAYLKDLSFSGFLGFELLFLPLLQLLCLLLATSSKLLLEFALLRRFFSLKGAKLCRLVSIAKQEEGRLVW